MDGSEGLASNLVNIIEWIVSMMLMMMYFSRSNSVSMCILGFFKNLVLILIAFSSAS